MTDISIMLPAMKHRHFSN